MTEVHEGARPDVVVTGGADDAGIDPDDLATCLRVFEALNDLPVEHPDSIAIQRATAGLFKTVRKRRRVERRQEVLAQDNAVIAATATGSPDRIDDETRACRSCRRRKVPGRNIAATTGVLHLQRAVHGG